MPADGGHPHALVQRLLFMPLEPLLQDVDPAQGTRAALARESGSWHGNM